MGPSPRHLTQEFITFPAHSTGGLCTVVWFAALMSSFWRRPLLQLPTVPSPRGPFSSSWCPLSTGLSRNNEQLTNGRVTPTGTECRGPQAASPKGEWMSGGSGHTQRPQGALKSTPQSAFILQMGTWRPPGAQGHPVTDQLLPPRPACSPPAQTLELADSDNRQEPGVGVGT